MAVDFSWPSERVIRELQQIIAWRGKPQVIRCADFGICHNGPDYMSGAI
jgi:putative transposase